MKKLILALVVLTTSVFTVSQAQQKREPTELEIETSSLVNSIVDENPSLLRVVGDVNEGDTFPTIMKDFAEYIVYDALLEVPLIGTNREDVPSTYRRIIDTENTSYSCIKTGNYQARCVYRIRYIESHKGKNFDATMDFLLNTDGLPVSLIENKISISRN